MKSDTPSSQHYIASSRLVLFVVIRIWCCNLNVTNSFPLFHYHFHASSISKEMKRTKTPLSSFVIPDQDDTNDESSSSSLSHLISSPERYANALNITVEEVKISKQNHLQASSKLYKRLKSSSSSTTMNNQISEIGKDKDMIISNTEILSGIEKHQLICQHRYKYGRHPFCCRDCWSYRPVCVCDQMKNDKRTLPAFVKEVIVWVHHREWGLTSNTGCLLSQTLENCHLLMKGLPEHDKKLEQLLAQGHKTAGDKNNKDMDILAVVLWPDNNKNKKLKQSNNEKQQQQQQQQTKMLDNGVNDAAATTITASNTKMTSPSSLSDQSNISLDELLHLKIQHGVRQKKIILIAVDGTWRNARRMVKRLPSHVRRLDLPFDVVGGDAGSLLAPLRARGTNISSNGISRSNNLSKKVQQKEFQEKENKHAEIHQKEVCTSQAVVGALSAFGLPHQDRDYVLNVTKTKVDRIHRYRGKV